MYIVAVVESDRGGSKSVAEESCADKSAVLLAVSKLWGEYMTESKNHYGTYSIDIINEVVYGG